MEEVNRHWDWLLHNLLHSLSVFENKEDVASFVKGKVKVGEEEERRWWCEFGGLFFLKVLHPAGPHRGGRARTPGRPGGRPRQVQGGAAQVRAPLRPAVVGEAGDVLLVLLLEGPRSSPGLPLPQHQPHVLLLLPAGEGRWVQGSALLLFLAESKPRDSNYLEGLAPYLYSNDLMKVKTFS